jgi:hypothetical protein
MLSHIDLGNKSSSLQSQIAPNKCLANRLSAQTFKWTPMSRFISVGYFMSSFLDYIASNGMMNYEFERIWKEEVTA